MIKDSDQFNQNIETNEEAAYFIENINKQYEVDKFKYVKQSKNLVYQYLKENKIIIDQRYDLKKQVSMWFASVKYKAYDNNTHKDVLIDYYEDFPSEDLFYFNQFLKGIEIQKFLNHENIEKIYDLNIISYPKINKMYVVYDYMETSLYHIIASQQQLTDDHFQFFMYQILRALHYIHSAKIVCCYLFPKQILINSDCSIKITDFTSCVGNQNKELRENLNNYHYMSPEYIVEQMSSQKSDIWSAGCIFAELINRAKLFLGQNNISIMTQILQFCGKQNEDDLKFYKKSNKEKLQKLMTQEEQISLQIKFPNATPLALDLLSKMLTFNIYKRFSALQCLQHEYFAELYDPQQEFISDQEFDWSSLDQKLTQEEIIMKLYKNQLFFQQN
ncbi:hypothetical protein ABPG72_006216 [Tetrahymena utriculariae]